MSTVLSYAVGVPVVKVSRIAGRYARPRSVPRGTRPARTGPSGAPDPERLREMYQASVSTLNVVRAFTAAGGADPRQVHAWNQDFVKASPAGRRYEELARRIDAALAFIRACGAAPGAFAAVEFFASQEALLLDYEAALTHADPRPDARADDLYDGSGHLLRIGRRTRQLDGAQVEFASRIRNPIVVELADPASHEALQYIERLDPEREPGRLTFVVGMGADAIRDKLPELVEKVAASGATVGWVSDPMRGNTVQAPSGHRTCRFDAILDEVSGFFEVHRALGTHAGGIQIELTTEDVTECAGGSGEVLRDDLRQRRRTAREPRLNRSQSLDLAFLVAERYALPPTPAARSNPAAR